MIIGVDEDTWSVTSATAPGGGDLANWASRCLTPIAPYFSPVPRLQVISHANGNVLIASTARSLGIVPCVEAGELVHYFRIHDQTLQAPEYLVSDILLGRRRQPYLEITGLRFNSIITKRDDRNDYDLRFSPILRVKNQGLVRAKNVRVGIVSLVKSSLSNIDLFSNHLLSYISVIDHPIGQRSHEVRSTTDIEPFSVSLFGRFGDYWVPLFNNNSWVIPYCWKAAVYITSEEGFPIWYQMSLLIDSDLLKIPNENKAVRHQLPYDSKFHNIERLIDVRPIVALNPIEAPEG